MSKEYIDRNELLELYQDDKLDLTKTCVPVEVVIQNIKDMPAADVVEVVHGKWLENDGRCYCNRCFEFSCTVMDDTGTIYNDLTKFCPNCGAKMDGGRKES